MVLNQRDKLEGVNTESLKSPTKRYDLKECATSGVYWVNLKFKDLNSIDGLLYTYLCIAICIAIFISVDGCILRQT